MLRRLAGLALTALLISLGASRADDRSQDLAALASLGPPRPDPDREWTVLAYMNADCNLEPDVLGDVNEMEAGQGGRVTVVALVDRHSEYDDGDGNWTGARALLLRPDDDPQRLNSKVLADPGELNLGDPEVLRTFVQAAIRTFPARKYALVLSAHGGGWAGMIYDDDAPGRLGRGHCTAPEMGRALREALAAVAVDRLDVVAMDLCLMEQLEVAVEFSGAARFLVASEALVPGEGLPYDAILRDLAGAATAKAAATAMVRRFGERCGEKRRKGATMSALDLDHTAPTLRALVAVLSKLTPRVRTDWPKLSRCLFFSESYKGRDDFRRGRQSVSSVDLVDLLGRASRALPDFPARQEVKDLEAEIGRFVVANYAGRARRLSHGLAIYAPARSSFLNPAYATTMVGRAGGWRSFLDAIHAAQAEDLSAPRITGLRLLADNGTGAVMLAGGQGYELTVEGKNILWTTTERIEYTTDREGYTIHDRGFLYGTFRDKTAARAEQSAEMLDFLMPEYADGKTVMVRGIETLHWQITNGVERGSATFDQSDPADQRYCRVPAVYSHPGAGRLRVDLFVDMNWGVVRDVIARVEQPDGTVTARAIEPAEDADVTLLQEHILPSGKKILLRTKTMKWRKGLGTIPVILEPGDYGQAFEVEGLAGSSEQSVLRYRVKPNDLVEEANRRAGRFRMSDLAGEWGFRFQEREPAPGRDPFGPVSMTLRIEPDPKRPDTAAYTLSGGELTETGFLRLDTREVPILYFHARVASGAPALIENYLDAEDDGYILKRVCMTHLLWSSGTPWVSLMELGQGWTARLERAGGAGLEGRWRVRGTNVVQVMAGGAYETRDGDRVVDRGTYVVRGRSITSRNAQGNVTVVDYVLEGDVLLFVTPAGRLIFDRIR